MSRVSALRSIRLFRITTLSLRIKTARLLFLMEALAGTNRLVLGLLRTRSTPRFLLFPRTSQWFLPTPTKASKSTNHRKTPPRCNHTWGKPTIWNGSQAQALKHPRLTQTSSTPNKWAPSWLKKEAPARKPPAHGKAQLNGLNTAVLSLFWTRLILLLKICFRVWRSLIMGSIISVGMALTISFSTSKRSR